MVEPEDALTKLRAAGFQEGLGVRDVRAGRCEIATLEAHNVILIPKDGQPLDAGNAAHLLEAYQNGSIQFDEGES